MLEKIPTYIQFFFTETPSLKFCLKNVIKNRLKEKKKLYTVYAKQCLIFFFA